MQKKAEQPHKRFLSNLLAAFCKWKVPTETIDLYAGKLAKWHLSDDQWARALSRIVADRPDSDLPTLGVIYEYLKQARTSELHRGEGMAFLTFQDANGRTMAVRVKAEGGAWVNAPAGVKARDGEPVSLQGHPGCQPKLPEGTLRVNVIPDKSYEDDRPCSQSEALETFRAGWQESGADPSECERVIIAMQLQHRNRARKSGFVDIRDLLLPQPTALPARLAVSEAAELVCVESEFVDEIPF